MGTIEVTFPSGGLPGRLLKWRVRLDTMVSAGRVLFLYNHVTPETDDTKNPEKKYRATRFGRVTKFLVKEGAVVQPGQAVMLLEGCKHSTVMKDLCAECGIDLRLESASNDNEAPQVSQASVPMVHSIPELKVCPELAEKIGKEDEERLLKDKKLALLVDLDQTLVHTTNDNVPPNMKDVFHYQLYGPNSPWYHTRLRPNTRHFLAGMSQLYELHICTFGARNYAHTVAALLDTDGTLFSHRILSRDECFDPASKTANLKALFPCGDDLVCIIDDREDVWQGCGNLVQVKPYHFFRHTGDIHAPPGMEKTDLPNLGESQDYTESDIEKPISEEIKNGLENTIEESSIVNEVPEDKKRAENESLPMLDNETSSAVENTKVSENSEKKSSSEEEKVTESNQSDVKTNEEAASTVDSSENNNNVDSCTATENDDNEVVEKVAESGVDAQREEVKTEELKSEKSKVIDKDDDDDYLLYLEDILRRIHAEFYAELDKEGKRRPLREIIPRVRAQVLKGVHITFSGLIPTHQKLHQSRAYKVARAFGAEVSQDLTEKTTHLVAIKPGTAKANAAKRNPNIKIVNPNWLWSCAERWEYVDERLFPLTSKGRASRIPPPHCSSPDRLDAEEQIEDRFADSINPLMSFTPEEIEIMDKEVEEDMEDQEIEPPIFDMEDIEEPDNYLEECEADEPDAKKRKLSESSDDESSSENENNCDDDDEDDPVTRFRRGEDLPDDLDLGDNSQDSIDDLEAVDTEDDREWNAMGAALEREFLSE